MQFERLVALRYLKAKRREKFISLISFISIAGVAVGVMALLVVIGVMTGFDQDLKRKILSVNAHVILIKPGYSIVDYDALVKKVEAVPGVASAKPFIYTQVMFSGPNNISGGVIRGLDLASIHQGGPAAIEVRDGSFTTLDKVQPAELPSVAVGNELAKNIGVRVGSQIKIISPLGTLTPMGRIPRVKNFQVGAIFHSGMFEFDNTLVYASIPQVQEYLGLGDKVTGLEIRVDDIYAADTVAAAVQTALGPGYQTRDWMRMNRSLFAALKLEKIAMFIILTLIVLVAAFNITSTLIMLVMEKHKDIAILKSLGATRRSIMKIFILEGLIIGAIGTVLGLGLGYLLTAMLKKYEFIKLPSDVYYISTLPVKVESLDVALIAGATMLISFLATIYPSWQASRLDPVEAIRFG
ncbi:lipoprotein-releasing ABC transporter permease subunit [Desulfobacca acetoxidans]|uniref:Lipoprotein releasing system, transmembrane protein, LolC/E family n=1 Tax=Desulfobacca acetoxidans (strain ATCC 700848 / DSM 11109 / ASRB2) TaxID=880072 RepID=F2NIR0_DESAR|nr:lipoprotein-releasing ABC transporter permease subunit [Desulfobacca acetoxidans]AEB10535.1 lipoprotein releasing system, transmembrane protein, LolC/E family [Desulfobacca acetoxidans DSM 11109]HAY20876.1 lipoprotein-releasing ABC transporter permease subunit [Desulfobacterales bacterium]